MLFAALLLPLLPEATADGPAFTPEIQYRPRYEADTGRDGAPGGGVSYVTHRARLGATLSQGDVSARIIVQDVRAWGTETHTRRDYTADGFGLPIGALVVSPGDWRLTVGRDEIGLLSERLVARSPWRQPGRHFDGARVLYAPDGWEAEASGQIVVDGDVFAFPTTDQVSPGGGDQVVGWLRGGPVRETWQTQGLLLVDVDRRADGAETRRLTPGVYAEGAAGAWSGIAEGYGQVGTMAGGDVSIGAFLVALSGRWTGADLPGAPFVELSYDGASGDADPTDDQASTFNTLFGANHRYWGHIDVATFVRAGESDGRGLHNPHLGLGASPSEDWSIELIQHAFAPMALPGDAALLATESDLHVTWTGTKGLAVQGGGATWVPLDGSNDPMELWAYLQLDVAFRGPKLGG